MLLVVRRDGRGKGDGADDSVDVKWASVMSTNGTMVLGRVNGEEHLRFWRLLLALFCCHCRGVSFKNARKAGLGGASF